MSETKTPEAIKNLPPFSHMENDKFRMTVINDKTRAEAMKKDYDEEDYIEIPIPGKPDMVFRLIGFIRIRDGAGDNVLNIKPSKDKGMMLYNLTGHPDSERCLAIIRAEMIQDGLGHITFQNVLDQVAETMKAYDGILNGAIKPEAGCHPEMTYLEEEKKGNEGVST